MKTLAVFPLSNFIIAGAKKCDFDLHRMENFFKLGNTSFTLEEATCLHENDFGSCSLRFHKVSPNGSGALHFALLSRSTNLGMRY